MEPSTKELNSDEMVTSSSPEPSSTCSSIPTGELTSSVSGSSIAVNQLGVDYPTEDEEQEDDDGHKSFEGSDETDEEVVITKQVNTGATNVRNVTRNTRVLSRHGTDRSQKTKRVTGIRTRAGYWQVLVKMTKPRPIWLDVKTTEMRDLTSGFIRRASEDFYEDMRARDHARIVALRKAVEEVKESLWGEPLCTHRKLEEAFKEVTELLED